MNASNPVLRGLPKRLVAHGLMDEITALRAVERCKSENLALVSHLVESGGLSARTLANEVAHEYGMALLDLDVINIEQCPKKTVDHRLVRKYQVLPLFQRPNRVYIAVCDPTNIQALNEIRFNTGSTVEPVIVECDKLAEAVERFLHAQEEDLGATLGTLEDIHLDNLDITADKEPADAPIGSDVDDAPVVRFINKLLLDAVRRGSSDIHFEPYEKSYRVRFRTDGILDEITRPPISLAPRLAARLKIMAQLDISERRVPQDGRIKLRLTKTRSIDFRVNTLPTLAGEKIVLRILDSASAKLGINALGYEDDQREAFEATLAQPQGMILVTGPTGSGKTVSLYTGLSILNTSERNISTAEDPIEINLEGINQVQMNPRVGMTFAEALRAFLRQDPDVIMVGEIRDLETAEIAIKAAQTGHLVLSTLHTNSAPETLTRLLNMGVASFNVATSVSLIIAQRLARRLCAHCAVLSEPLPEKVLIEEGFHNIDIPTDQLRIHHPVGCKLCAKGYKGRTGVYEVLRVTPAIARIIMEGGNAIDIADQARKEGFRTLRQGALKKVAEGTISLQEANRVTKD